MITLMYVRGNKYNFFYYRGRKTELECKSYIIRAPKIIGNIGKNLSK